MALTAYASASWSFPTIASFSGRFVASDPTIVVDGGIFRMFYTDLVEDGTTIRPVIAEVVSADGWTWTPLGGTTASGVVLTGGAGDEANLEGASIFMAGNEYVLLYSTYADVGDPLPQFPASLYAAVSTDGSHFTPVAGGPVLAPTAGWYDNDAIYSPTVVAYQGGYLMLYCGHAYTDASATGGSFGVSLLAAVSPDGLSWTKSPSPILQADPTLPWMSEGIAEPSMIRGPDGKYYLFFTGVAGEQRAIGIAVAADPLGPWEIAPQPIVTTQSAGLGAGGEVIAPHAELVNGVLRLWYTEVTPQGSYSIAYAESDWGGGFLPGPGQAPHWLGTSLDDVIAGTNSSDRVTSAGGDDVVTTGLGNDTIDAGAGNDVVGAGLDDDVVFGGTGNDLLYMEGGNDTADGGDGADIIIGEAGTDLLRGSLGDDVIDGGADADTVDGGAGNDVLFAGAGNDLLLGGAGVDVLVGEDGDDTLSGGALGDALAGGNGTDTADYSASTGVVVALDGAVAGTGDAANDILDSIENLVGSATAADLLYGDVGANRLEGLGGNDTLDGGLGDDTLDGGTGVDTMKGGIGNDLYVVDTASDVVVELTGEGTADRVSTSVDYTLSLNVETLSTTVGAGTAAINLTGNSQANTLIGNAGNNILDGRGGSDSMRGNGGADSFVFRDTPGPTNIDAIVDFSVVDDTIRLENAVFTALVGTGTLTAAEFAANTSGTALASSDRIIYETDTGKLFYDSNGNAAGGAVQFGLLSSGLALTNADFFII